MLDFGDEYLINGLLPYSDFFYFRHYDNTLKITTLINTKKTFSCSLFNIKNRLLLYQFLLCFISLASI